MTDDFTRILKYPIEVTDLQSITILADKVTPLSVGIQRGEPVLWVMVRGEKYPCSTNTVRVFTACTGQNYDGPIAGKFVGTYQLNGFVGHVFCEVV